MTNRPTCLLVVDDDLSNLESLEKTFVREGMRVLTATNGKAALDLIRRERIDVVLSDLMMPGMSGIDLVRALEAMDADVELVMMTAYDYPSARLVETMRLSTAQPSKSVARWRFTNPRMQLSSAAMAASNRAIAAFECGMNALTILRGCCGQ